MTPDVVVDIGNSRMKWGRCLPTVADGGSVSLPLDDLNAWDDQTEAWGIDSAAWWAAASVNPPVLEVFKKWRRTKGGNCVVFDKPSRLPIRTQLDEPDAVGIDRLFSALAAHRLAAPQPAIVISVGTATTGDLIDSSGTFLGGVILPGPRLMAESLRAHTAQLPLVDAPALPSAEAPGKNTHDAILAGIRYAIVGATFLLVDRYAAICGSPWVFVTGGAAGDLGEINFGDPVMGTRLLPALTLEGIRIAAEALP